MVARSVRTRNSGGPAIGSGAGKKLTRKRAQPPFPLSPVKQSPKKQSKSQATFSPTSSDENSPSPKKVTKKSVKKSPEKKKAEKVVKNKKENKTKEPTWSLEDLAHALHTSALPNRLPCREEEFEILHEFIRDNVLSRTSRSYYISGVPGTGKTATVLQVIRQLKEDSGCPRFNFVHVNGMRLREPNRCFTEVFRQLNNGTVVSAAKASHKLNTMFRQPDPKRLATVLLVDELDLLCTKRQHVLYTIFDWATLQTASLTVLAIANTLDLPERLLTHRVSSRLGMSRLCFQPYNFEQIDSILSARLQGGERVERDALSLISRKVASISGDLRRALEICRNSVNSALHKGKSIVTIEDVQEVVREMTRSGRVIAIQGASLHEKFFLQAAVAEYRRTGHEEWSFSSLEAQYRSLCRADEETPLTMDSLLAVSDRLCTLRLFVACPGKATWSRKIRLNLPADDITFAINSAASC